MVRAKIARLAAEGHSDAEITRRLDCTDKTAPKWRRSFAAQGLAGLDERPRSGRPRSFSPAAIAEVKVLACELPAETGRPLSRWSAAELAREAVARGIVCSISGTTVWRWLAEDAIRPWAWRSRVFPRDPDFREKAGRALDITAPCTAERKQSTACKSRWANLVLVHLPTHAPWLNQIEIYWSILARKALTPCHFDSLEELTERILGVQAEFAKLPNRLTGPSPAETYTPSSAGLDQRGRLAPAA